jgi:hypothetical protein
MGQMIQRASLLSAFFLFAVAANTASGQSQRWDPTTGKPIDPSVREVSLVRQDQSDCQNGNVSDQDPSLLGGIAYVRRGSDGTTSVKVGITAKPNTSYHFFLKCVRILGDIKTGDEGTGEAEFSFRTNEVGNVYAFDMYPEGAPAGNKYQSVQVKH